MWRYDKAYPFNWERAYFREGRHTTIADTPLGKFGLLICWDAAHSKLWQQYAGKIDAMLIPSCPPRVNAGELVFPDGKRIKNWFRSGHFAEGDLQDQAAWLRVPVIHASGSGKFRSPMPAPGVSVMGFVLGRPKEWLRVRDSAAVQLEADYGQHTQIISADGQVIGCATEAGDSFTLAEVKLADEMPKPATPQPKMRTSAIAYFVADIFGPAVLRSVYRRRHIAYEQNGYETDC